MKALHLVGDTGDNDNVDNDSLAQLFWEAGVNGAALATMDEKAVSRQETEPL